MSDDTSRTGVHLPPRVRRGERPKAETINGILDALGPRQIRIKRHPYRGDLGGAAIEDQFQVVSSDDTHVQIRGGVWQRIYFERVGSSAPYTFEPHTEIASLGTPYELESAEEVTDDTVVWLKLDWSGVVTTLTVEYLTTTPTWEEKVYWAQVATVNVTDGAIESVDQWHMGPIVTTDYGQPVLCEEPS